MAYHDVLLRGDSDLSIGERELIAAIDLVLAIEPCASKRNQIAAPT